MNITDQARDSLKQLFQEHDVKDIHASLHVLCDRPLQRISD